MCNLQCTLKLHGVWDSLLGDPHHVCFASKEQTLSRLILASALAQERTSFLNDPVLSRRMPPDVMRFEQL